MKKLLVLVFIGFALCFAIYINLLSVLWSNPQIINYSLFTKEIRIPIQAELTAYCPCVLCCGEKDLANYGRTSSGVMALEGITIATDNSILPIGSIVSIYGKDYTVQDKGGAIKGYRIDIFMDSHEAALEFGRQEVTVYWILEREVN